MSIEDLRIVIGCIEQRGFVWADSGEMFDRLGQMVTGADEKNRLYFERWGRSSSLEPG